jgi:hypothetical protein
MMTPVAAMKSGVLIDLPSWKALPPGPAGAKIVIQTGRERYLQGAR